VTLVIFWVVTIHRRDLVWADVENALCS
jgi:hypothetical protein